MHNQIVCCMYNHNEGLLLYSLHQTVIPSTEKSLAWNEWRDTSRPKIYCMVPFMWLGSRMDQYKVIMNTWGKRCDGINFFVDVVSTPIKKKIPLPSNVIELPMIRKSIMNNNKEKHIWEKMWRGWIWVSNNNLTDYHWFIKVDDDNFLFPENILRLVKEKQWKYTDAHYFGHKVYHRNIPLIAGAFEGFSRSTLSQLAHVYKNMPKGGIFEERGRCEDRRGATEELSTAICLKTIGIQAESTQDDNGEEAIMLFQPQAHFLQMKRPPLGDKKEGWFWKAKPLGTGELKSCCSRRPLAFHGFKQASDLTRLNEFYYMQGKLETFDYWLNDNQDADLTQYWIDTRSILQMEITF